MIIPLNKYNFGMTSMLRKKRVKDRYSIKKLEGSVLPRGKSRRHADARLGQHANGDQKNKNTFPGNHCTE
jgi:hypothetical protein